MTHLPVTRCSALATLASCPGLFYAQGEGQMGDGGRGNARLRRLAGEVHRHAERLHPLAGDHHRRLLAPWYRSRLSRDLLRRHDVVVGVAAGRAVELAAAGDEHEVRCSGLGEDPVERHHVGPVAGRAVGVFMRLDEHARDADRDEPEREDRELKLAEQEGRRRDAIDRESRVIDNEGEVTR